MRNCGVVEYSDFLKRNMEANKYLLTTAERGFVNLPNLTVAMNEILIGTSNEKYLVAFKRDPSFTSFKGRFELIRVPYLREYKREAKIYQRYLERVSGGRHVAPHTSTVAALWAVLTRLRSPDSQHYDGTLARIARRMTPIEKARLYDRGELPDGLDDDELKLLRSSIDEIASEFDGEEEEFEGRADAAYEGRRGASPREVMSLLTDMVVDCERDVVTPVDVFEILPRLIEDPSVHSFLRIPQDGDYHDPEGFVELVRGEYLKHVASEIQKASDLVDAREYHRLFEDYMHHVRAYGTHEKVLNRQTGKPEDPDERLMSEVEEHLGVSGDIHEYRQNIMTKVAAFRLGHPDKPIVLADLFRDQFDALEKSFFEERKGRILAMVEDALEVHSRGADKMVKERRAAAQNMIERLIADFGYSAESVGQVLGYFQRHFEDLD